MDAVIYHDLPYHLKSHFEEGCYANSIEMATDNRRSSPYKGRNISILRHSEFFRTAFTMSTDVSMSRCWAYPADNIKQGFQKALIL